MSYYVLTVRYIVDDEAEANKLYDACAANVSSLKLSAKPNAAHIAEKCDVDIVLCDHDEPNPTGSVLVRRYSIDQDRETIKDAKTVKEVVKL